MYGDCGRRWWFGWFGGRPGLLGALLLLEGCLRDCVQFLTGRNKEGQDISGFMDVVERIPAWELDSPHHEAC
jgi:hypothetical protein